MKRTSLFLVLSSFVLIFTASCKKAGKTGLLVPKDAAVVVHINSASLSSKLSWEEISQTDWFKEMSKEADDSTAQKLLKDPGQSGIDTKADLVFYMKRQGRGGYMIFEGSIKDATTFESFNKEINKGAATVKDGDINYMTLEKSGMLAWNKSKFAYIADSPMPDMQQAFDKSSSFETYKFPADSLKKFGKDALTLESSDNLDSDSRFTSMINDGSDMHLWMNASNLYGNSLGGMLSMMKFNLLLENNVSATSLNFDNGKIVMKSKGYYGKEMSKLLADYPAKPISKDILNRIPSPNVIGVVAMNFQPEGLKEFLKITGFDGMANGFLGRKIGIPALVERRVERVPRQFHPPVDAAQALALAQFVDVAANRLHRHVEHLGQGAHGNSPALHDQGHDVFATLALLVGHRPALSSTAPQARACVFAAQQVSWKKQQNDAIIVGISARLGLTPSFPGRIYVVLAFH